MPNGQDGVEQELHHVIQSFDFSQLQQSYTSQGELLTVHNFLPQHVVDQLMEEVNDVRPQLNRNYIPTHKKGGSVSFYLLRKMAPTILALYRSPTFMNWLSRLAGVPLLLCPDDDPHACALYFYTEPGDHIGFHYDTSYYKGARYTVLLGLVDQSTSRLVCRLHTKDPQRETKELDLSTDPGLLVFFNGDTLYHAVTPLGEKKKNVLF